MSLSLIYRAKMAGVSHGNLALYAREIAIGTEFQLDLQQTNPFDRDAVAVNYKGDRVGWLQNKDPKMSGKKEIISKLLQVGIDLQCRVMALDPTMHPENQVMLGIWICVEE